MDDNDFDPSLALL